MPARLVKPYDGQLANTLYWGSATSLEQLRALGIADDRVELASDYAPLSRRTTAATVTSTSTARVYHQNSASGQTLTINLLGFPQDTVLTVIQEGAGKTTLAAATGTTLNTAAASLLTSGQYAVAQIMVTGPGVGIAFGGLGG